MPTKTQVPGLLQLTPFLPLNPSAPGSVFLCFLAREASRGLGLGRSGCVEALESEPGGECLLLLPRRLSAQSIAASVGPQRVKPNALPSVHFC